MYFPSNFFSVFNNLFISFAIAWLKRTMKMRSWSGGESDSVWLSEQHSVIQCLPVTEMEAEEVDESICMVCEGSTYVGETIRSVLMV